MNEQVQIYKISKGWKIFTAITAPILVTLFGFIMAMPFLLGRSNETALVIFFFLLGTL